MEVLVAVDGSDNSDRALRRAVAYAEAFDATVDVVHVSDGETSATDDVLERAEATLAELDAEADVSLDVIEMGVPTDREVAKELLALVEREGYDHVFMGHHGVGMVERTILGSAAEGVVRNTTVPVTVVP
ncbi:universal stress protein [Halobaculum marinum]|uniref:Universal stress protein n=1 Tax=Halobaculum marinum TaxID=3031996 RepID=A0ABD5WV45_9EURY|nr:universal stress protein [Halobaculum sp. DT55]